MERVQLKLVRDGIGGKMLSLSTSFNGLPHKYQIFVKTDDLPLMLRAECHLTEEKRTKVVDFLLDIGEGIYKSSGLVTTFRFTGDYELHRDTDPLPKVYYFTVQDVVKSK